MLERVQQLVPVAEEAGLTLAQLSLAWVLQHPNVSAAIIGATRPEQVKSNVEAVGVTLDPEVYAKVNEILDPVAVKDPTKTRSPKPRA